MMAQSSPWQTNQEDHTATQTNTQNKNTGTNQTKTQIPWT